MEKPVCDQILAHTWTQLVVESQGYYLPNPDCFYRTIELISSMTQQIKSMNKR